MNTIGLSLPVQIAQSIVNDMVTGRLLPGMHLKEEALSSKFGTSRAPVREAIYLLTQKGLVEKIPRKGSVIKQYSSKELRDLYDVRTHLEIYAVQTVPLPLYKKQEIKLSTILKQMEQALNYQSINQYASLNLSFHRELVLLSDNEILFKLYTQLELPLHVFMRYAVNDLETLHKSYNDHRLITHYLISEMRQQAIDVLIRHDHSSFDRVLSYMTGILKKDEK